MTENILAAVIGAIGVIMVAVIGAIGAAKLGVGANQEKLVTTLKDIVAAQDAKIEELNTNRQEDQSKISTLEKKVHDLEALTIRQAQIIDTLTTHRGTNNAGSL